MENRKKYSFSILYKVLCSLCFILFSNFAAVANGFNINRGDTVYIYIPQHTQPVANTAAEIFASDIYAINSSVLKKSESAEKADIILEVKKFSKFSQAYRISLKKGKIHICGTDSHGLAFALMELSRRAGVSPWIWWADSQPEKKDIISIDNIDGLEEHPSVEYRGIFINDEDWGITPWSWKNFEKGKEGHIGPKTHEKIFELLLRLKANTFWPAMHECTYPFFLTEGNRETARKYGIFIGTSHCEPMACNANGEWKVRGKGDYNYLSNRDNVEMFWKERVEEVKDQNIIYTLGMRGIHDGMMQGVKGNRQHKEVLQQIINSQRSILESYTKKNADEVPQVFIPYKEVLDVYNEGLELPEDITLMWTDDNYGFIRHFPNRKEKEKKGGNGVYYHISYWGRPHDYLWLGAFSPYRLFQQMTQAFDSGISKMWILNVGDIKPAEYQIELFLDLAWNFKSTSSMGVDTHLRNFLGREFGYEYAASLQQLMKRHFILSHSRMPEFMGGTRTEEADKVKWNTIDDLPWTDTELRQRMQEYSLISDSIESIWHFIPENRKDCFFQTVKYNIQAAAEMNKKFILAQMARHAKADYMANLAEYDYTDFYYSLSDSAYRNIQVLTDIYNNGIHNRGKWNGIMSSKPRNLPVFNIVEHTVSDKISLQDDNSIATIIPAKSATTENNFNNEWNITRNGSAGFSLNGVPTGTGLGESGNATKLKKGKTYKIDISSILRNYGNNSGSKVIEATRTAYETGRISRLSLPDSIELEFRFLPLHADNPEGTIRVETWTDGNDHKTFDIETKGRSEEWKQNVLRGYSTRTVSCPTTHSKNRKKHFYLNIKPLDNGIFIDKIIIYYR